MNESLNQFVKRLRLERAIYLMSHAHSRSLTDIALECGFGSSSDFSRNFKARFGVPPSVFDIDKFRATKRDAFVDAISAVENGPKLTRLPRGENPDNFEVRLRDFPQREVIYIRVLNPYESGVPEACQQLVAWADERQLEGTWLGYMWEDPEIVALENCRYDVALAFKDSNQIPASLDKAIGRHTFPPMTVAEVEVVGNIELEQRAIDWLYGTWLPKSGFEPDDQPAFESWHGRPYQHGLEHFELNLQLPIKQ